MGNRRDHLFGRLLRQAVALLLCSILIMHNDYFVGQAFAQDEETTPHPDAHRLSGCENASQASGDQCTIQTVNYDHQDIIVTEGYYSMLVLWAAAMISLFQIRRCLQPSLKCGWSTLFSAVAGLALLAGEVVQIAMYSEAKDKIEYRADMLRKFKDHCAGSGSGSAPAEGEGMIDGKSICDQYTALIAQKKSYEKAKDAAEIKFMLQTGAAVAYAIAAIIEYVAAYQDNATDASIISAATTAAAANASTVAGCTMGAAACAAACGPCTGAIASASAAIGEMIGQWNTPLPMVSQAQCETILQPLNIAQQTVQGACSAAGPCAASGNAFSATLTARYHFLNCTQSKPCTLGCQSQPLTVVAKNEEPSSEIPVMTESDAPDFFLKMVQSMFKMDAYAGDSPSASNIHSIITKSLGLAGAAVIIIVALFKVSDKMSDTLYGTPLKRGLWNTLLAALAGGGAAYTKAGVIAKLEKNIETINQILKAADQSTTKVVVGTAAAIPFNSVVIDSDNMDGAPIISNDNPPLPCPGGGDGKGKCNEISKDMAVSLQELELGSLAGLSKSLASLGKELGGSRDVSPNAMRSTSSLANNAARVKKLLKDSKNLYNQSRGRVGLAPIPFEKVERDMLKRMYDQTRATLKAQKTDAKTLLSAMEPQGNLTEQDKKRFAEKVQAFESQKAQAGAAAGVAADPFAAFTLQNAEVNPAISLESENELNPGTEGEVAIDDSLIIRSNDIETNPAISLFDMLTSRYMKSAYPVLFEEQK
ncbi:MAG TPA: hypothetical protein DCY86_16230 [Bdellovibrionales bacterium]|nr:hypothetical protein [Bdellovibrionales bacterium]